MPDKPEKAKTVLYLINSLRHTSFKLYLTKFHKIVSIYHTYGYETHLYISQFITSNKLSINKHPSKKGNFQRRHFKVHDIIKGTVHVW